MLEQYCSVSAVAKAFSVKVTLLYSWKEKIKAVRSGERLARVSVKS